MVENPMYRAIRRAQRGVPWRPTLWQAAWLRGACQLRPVFLPVTLLLCWALGACASLPRPDEPSPPSHLGTAPTEGIHPTTTPEMERPIVITPTAGAVPSDSALFYLTVTVEDERSAPLAALVTLSWPDSAAHFTFGPAASVEIPLRLLAAAPRFWVTVEKEGYLPVHQPFEVMLSEDLVYEWVVRLQWVGLTASGSVCKTPSKLACCCGGCDPWDSCLARLVERRDPT